VNFYELSELLDQKKEERVLSEAIRLDGIEKERASKLLLRLETAIIKEMERYGRTSASPISVQMMESLNAVKNAMIPHMQATGIAAVNAFIEATRGHFYSSFAVLAGLQRKYRIPVDFRGNLELIPFEEGLFGAIGGAVGGAIDGTIGRGVRATGAFLGGAIKRFAKWGITLAFVGLFFPGIAAAALPAIGVLAVALGGKDALLAFFKSASPSQIAARPEIQQLAQQLGKPPEQLAVEIQSKMRDNTQNSHNKIGSHNRSFAYDKAQY